MFIRSKYEKKGIKGIINGPINLHHIECIGVEANAILFNSHDEMYSWVYKNEDQRNEEYEWILSKLDCVVNENFIPDSMKEIGRKQSNCNCGGTGYLKSYATYSVKCGECGTRSDSLISVDHAWKLWDNMQLKMEINDKKIVHDTTASILYIIGDEFTDGSKRKNRHAGSTSYHNEELINGVWKIA